MCSLLCNFYVSTAPGREGVLHLDDTIPGSAEVYDMIFSTPVIFDVLMVQL